MPVVTISRGLGSGGDSIATRVANQLGVPYLDREIMRAVAARAGVSEGELKDVERGPGLLDRVLTAMAFDRLDADIIPWPVASDIRPFDAVLPYRHLIEQVIQLAGEQGSAVIVGHGASAILAENRRVLRCLIVAPIEARVARVMVSENIERKTAERRIAESDRARHELLKARYNLDWSHPRHYDLIINTERISCESAVNLIVFGAKTIDMQNA